MFNTAEPLHFGHMKTAISTWTVAVEHRHLPRSACLELPAFKARFRRPSMRDRRREHSRAREGSPCNICTTVYTVMSRLPQTRWRTWIDQLGCSQLVSLYRPGTLGASSVYESDKMSRAVFGVWRLQLLDAERMLQRMLEAIAIALKN